VRSASLLVTGRAVHDAVAMARDHPALALGLHWDVWGENEREFDVEDAGAVRGEISRQLEEFERLVGRPPTHVDSHMHAHRSPVAFPVVVEAIEPLGIPVRGDGRVAYVGGFFAQWEWMVTDLSHVSVEFLLQVLREDVTEPWTEIGCHPGYRSPDFDSGYLDEREVELRTLCHPKVKAAVDDDGLVLHSFADYGEGRR